MASMMTMLRVVLAAVAVFAATLMTPSAAWAIDTLELKDGRSLEGTVVREVDGYVWFRYRIGGIEQETMFSPDQITKLTKDAESKPAGEEGVKPADKSGSKARRSGAPRAAIITLGEAGDKDMVGIYMTAKALKDAIPLLEADDVDVVVFLINSGGGALIEIQKLSDVIHNEYKPRFRTVAWIKSAISAAAMTAHCLEEIYFMPNGNYGACTGWYGALQAVEGRQLEEVLYMMEKISARGNHPKEIMRSMQIMEPLSATIDETGVVHWYQDETSGEHVVNPEGRILTFNAVQAEKFKFSRGTAATLDELTKLMGYTELEWVGQNKPGFGYPISKAEELQMTFRDRTFRDQEATEEYFTTYLNAIGMAQNEQDRQKRGALVNKARQSLERMKRMVRNNPAFMLFVFNMVTEEQFDLWVEQQEELLRRLMR